MQGIIYQLSLIERQHTFQRHKTGPTEQSYSEVINIRIYNNSNIVVFSDNIASFSQNISFISNKWLKQSIDSFKYFPRATMFELLFYVEPTFGEDQFDTEVIHVGINDVMNTTVTGSLLQNILKREARYKMHGNILMTFLYRDGLQLSHLRNDLLANNSQFNILKKKIHVPSKYTPKLERSGLNEELSEMENLQKFKKYHQMGHLRNNSLTNKMFD